MNRTSLASCEEQSLDENGFAFRRKRLGTAAGGKKLGVSWFELQPGTKAFPHHFHLANEEAVFILEGEGVVRFGDEEHAVRSGDFLAFPPGPPAHQILNRSLAPLRYLAISTVIEPEVVLYPDSKKVGVRSWSFGITSNHRQGDAVDYYEGEK